MVSTIIENKDSLIMQDTVKNGPHNQELKRYIESLKKPLERIIISHDHEHHWVGLEMLPGVPVYATEETIDGVVFRYMKSAPNVMGPVLWIEFPQQKALIHHHLAYVGMHAPMPPIPPGIEMLKD